MRCFCGCGERAIHRHHCVYAQHCVREAKTTRQASALIKDDRNLVEVAFRCHSRHHTRTEPYEMRSLPDSVFAFAGELLGPAGFDYLMARYAGDDPRCSALLEVAA